MAEKSEKATPKKLRDARKKGQVAKSKDFPAAFTFIVSLFLVLSMSTDIFYHLGGYMVGMIQQITVSNEFPDRIEGYVQQAIETIFRTSIPIAAATAALGVLVNFLIIGPLFSLQSMKPDIKKFNPVTNLKNMFKLKTLVELIKSILKITGALILIWTVVYNRFGDIMMLCTTPVFASAMLFGEFLKSVVLRVGIFFIAVAVFDLIYQKKNFAKEMMMEKYEVKQEYKDTEGDPHIKGKRRQRAQEIAYQEGPGAAKRASAIVTNPVHIAVALEYDAEEDPAPKICTMGKGEMAKKIIEIGLDNNIPIMRNITLATQLYEMGNISDYVPEETYDAIAEILKWLQKVESEAEYNVALFGGVTPEKPEET